MKKNVLVAVAGALWWTAAAVPVGAQSAGPVTTLVSGGGNDWSSGCDVSSGGRAVAFVSAASDLVPGDTNDRYDVFLATGGDVERVSVTSRERQSATHTVEATVSDDGTKVAFLASSYRLKDPDGRRRHVFVRDTATGKTTRVNVSTEGGRPDSGSGGPDISGNGRHVAFHSAATNLTGHRDRNRAADVYVRRLARSRTNRVSFDAHGGDPDGVSADPAVSRNGRFLAFTSHATDLVANDDNRWPDVFRFDRKTGRTIRVSVASDGTGGELPSHEPAISADGRFVAFQSQSAFVPEDTNDGFDVYVHDVFTGITELVSTGPAVAGNGRSWMASISDDGRYVAFTSTAPDLAPGDTNGTHPVDDGSDAFVRDRLEQETTRVSVGDDGRSGDRDSTGVRISPDGSYVCWSSESSNLVDRDENGQADVFLRGPLWGQE